MDSDNPPSIGTAALGLAQAIASSGIGDCKVTITFSGAPATPENATIIVEPMLHIAEIPPTGELREDVDPVPGLLDTLVLFHVEEEV